MSAFRTLSPWVLSTTLLLAACGGSDPHVPGSGSPAGAPTTPGSFTAVVSFGDSLSDVGTYAPATSLAGNGTAPYFGGKFTTNGTGAPRGTVWVENVAASLGLLATPAEVGFAGLSVACPAAADPALAGTCTAYGQGGARITDPNGIGHRGRPHRAGGVADRQPPDALRKLPRQRPRPGMAGNNDVFVKFEEFAAAAAQIQAEAAAGLLTADQANKALFAPRGGAGAMKQAALELAALVRTRAG